MRGAAAWLALGAGVGVAVGLGPPARADAPTQTSEVVVTASRLPQTADRPTIDASVLAPDAAAPGATLGELLQTASDVAVQQPGGPAGVASVFLRGAKPNFTLVMIDGVPLNDQTNSRGGSTDVSGLNLLGLDHVEVVRGALSSIYGSGAVEGAINLVVPGGMPTPTAAVQVEGGTDRDASGAVSLRGPLAGGAGASLSADWDDAGHDVESSSRVNEAVMAKLAPLDGSDAYGLTVRLSRSDAHAFPDDSGGPRLAVLRDVEHNVDDEMLIGAHWRFALAPGWTLELNGAGSHSDTKDDTPGVAPGVGSPVGVPAGTSEERYDFARGQAIVRIESGSAWRSLVGVEVQDERGQDVSDLTLFGAAFPSHFTLDRVTPAAFTETNLDLGRLLVDASVRADWPGDLGGHVTGQVSAAARLTSRLTAHASLGHSFKAPSFYGLGNAFIGNPDLKPETADTSEVGLAWAGDGGLRVEANLFRIQYHQLVDFDAGPPPRLVNRSAVLSQGVQVILHAPVTERGRFEVSASYIDTRDQADGSRLLELPAWRVTSAFDWRLSARLRARLDGVFVGDRLDSSIPTGDVILAPYAVADARLFYGLGPRDDLEASVENALNARYEDAVGFPSPGITGRLSLLHRF
ncbi:MAG TPA: TonB-dependent receptor [Caulobacteraceae bacterium]